MNYDRFVATSMKLIGKYGRNVTLLNKQLGAFNPLNNTVANAADTTRIVKAVFTDYKDREIDGEIIRRGDKQCLIGAISPALSNKEILVDGSDQYNIVNIETVKPGDTVILYKLQVRR